MIRGVFHAFGELVLDVVRGCLVTALVAGGLSFLGLLLVTHHAPTSADTVLLTVIAVLAGLLGAAFALIYHLSHVREIGHAIDHVVEHEHATHSPPPDHTQQR